MHRMGWVAKEGYATKLLAQAVALNCAGCEVQLVHLTEGKYAHYHKKKTEFFYILSGQGILLLEGETISLAAGVHVIVPPHAKHTFINEGEALLEMLMLKTNNTAGDTYTD